MKDCNYIMPKSALAIYIKLYIKKKATNKKHPKILVEATKSWVTLTKTEKQHFINLFEEYKAKLEKNFAAKLQSVQPYMKKKHKSPIRPCIDTENLPSEHGGNSNIDSRQLTIGQEAHNQQNEINEEEHCNEQIHSQHSDFDLNVPRWIPEPTPPIRSSMELFEILKNNNESTHHLKWTSLSISQKLRYQRAVLTIKNEYIKQYRAYLEQLSSEELFNHYKSKC